MAKLLWDEIISIRKQIRFNYIESFLPHSQTLALQWHVCTHQQICHLTTWNQLRISLELATKGFRLLFVETHLASSFIRSTQVFFRFHLFNFSSSIVSINQVNMRWKKGFLRNSVKVFQGFNMRRKAVEWVNHDVKSRANTWNLFNEGLSSQASLSLSTWHLSDWHNLTWLTDEIFLRWISIRMSSSRKNIYFRFTWIQISNCIIYERDKCVGLNLFYELVDLAWF